MIYVRRSERRMAELEAEVAAKDARVAEQDAWIAEPMGRVEALMRQVAELTERLGSNSSNSTLPPSSDPPGARQKPQEQRP